MAEESLVGDYGSDGDFATRIVVKIKMKWNVLCRLFRDMLTTTETSPKLR